MPFPFLVGITAAYKMPLAYDDAKPTLVLVGFFTTSTELCQGYYHNEKPTSTMNVIATELLGHVQIRTKPDNWLYCDIDHELATNRGTRREEMSRS